MLEKFIKSYSGSYQYTAMLRHKGVVIAFAMDASRRISYTVLDLSGTSDSPAGGEQKPKSFLDVDAWQGAPTELIFPNEIAEVGFGVADQTLLPVFKKNSNQPEVAGTILPPGKEKEYDYFKSTTARFAADAPFQVLTDGRYVYVFRQAIDATNDSMVYVDDAGHVLVSNGGTCGYVILKDAPPTKKTEWVVVSLDQTTPLIKSSTLLADRFVLVGTRLEPVMEARFQRSRSKTRPASRKDSLGPMDLDGNIFYEPTQELRFMGSLKDGHFSVLLLPTAIAEIQRWQVFAQNAITGRLDSYNVERSPDGWFNTRGALTYTCEDHPDVFTRQPGKCDQCGMTLIPRIVNRGYAESALQFNGQGDHISVQNQPGLNFTGAITVEAWIKPDQRFKKSGVVVGTPGYSLAIDDLGHPVFTIKTNQTQIQAVSNFVVVADTWYHIAGTFDGTAARVLVNGNAEPKENGSGARLSPGANLYIAQSAEGPQNPFAGVIDEVRLWKRARPSVEMKADLHQRLTGLESDLAGYWRFDEGMGNIVHDQTYNKADGVISGAVWIPSNAPVGEHPGIERTSFELIGRTFASVPTSLLYYQQSNAASGYSGEQKPLKNSGRVMLAVATNDGGDKNHIAALDFGVSNTGRLAQIPDEVELALINAESATDQSLNDQLDGLSKKQEDLISFNDDISRLEDSVAHFSTYLRLLDTVLALPVGTATVDIDDPEFDYLKVKLDILSEKFYKHRAAADSLQALEYQLQTSQVYVYENHNYEGRLAGPFILGSTSEDLHPIYDFNDMISSMKVPEPLQVRVYSEIGFTGNSKVFHAGDPYLDDLREMDRHAGVGEDHWNDKIRGLKVEQNPDSDFEAKVKVAQKAVDDAQAAYDQAKADVADARDQLQEQIKTWNQDKGNKEIQRDNLQHDLGAIQSNMQSGVSAKMPRLHTDPFGLTISGGLLGFAWTDDAPLLFDSATGSLALYFRGKANQFFVAYYDTFTERARITLSDALGADGAACFSTSTAYDQLRMTIADAPQADTCTVTVAYFGDSAEDFIIQETWEKVPRAAADFAKVLNGQAIGHTHIGAGWKTKAGDGRVVLKISDPGISRALNIGATLMIGDEHVVVNQRASIGDRQIQVTGEAAANEEFPAEELPVFYVEYDYVKNARCEGIRGDLSNGSLLIRAIPIPAADGSLKVIANTDPNQPRFRAPRFTCKWTAAAPGSTLTFDGQTQFAESAAPQQFEAAGDLTVEAWVKPGYIQDNAFIIHHNAKNSRYILGLEKTLSALMFDGATYIDLGVGVVTGASFTQEAWIFPAADDNEYHGFLGTQLGGNERRSPSLWIVEKNMLHVGFGDGHNWNSFKTDAVLSVNAWNHVAATFDGTTYRVYINSELKSENAAFAGKIPCDTPIKNIGRVDNYFKGAMDEVRIWRRARTQAEIQANMNRRLTSDEPDLIGYWHFENGEAKDFSLNGKNGQALHIVPRATWSFNGMNFESISATGLLPGNTPHTLEAWIRASGLPSTRSWPLLLGNPEDGAHHWLLKPNGQMQIGVWGSGGGQQSPTLTVGQWTHIASAFDGKTLSVYINGEKQGESVDATFNIHGTSLILAKAQLGESNFAGHMDEVRLWKRARTQDEIKTDMNRQLNGNEADLLAYRCFETNTISPLPAYAPVIGVGYNDQDKDQDTVLEAREIIPHQSWTHLAAAYHQAYGLQFDGSNTLDCGNNITLDIDQNLTIEAFLKVKALNRQQVIIRRGRFDDGDTDQHVPYSLSINSGNQLEFSFEDVNQGKHTYTYPEMLQQDTFYKAAIIRWRQSQTHEIKDQDGKTTGGNVTSRDVLIFYLNGWGTLGTWASYDQVESNPVGNSNKSVIIGENFVGTLAEVRVWNIARPFQDDLGQPITGNEKGLVSWWRFGEGQGTQVMDSKSQNHATINGAQWVKSPDPDRSSLKLYINGQLRETQAVDASAWSVPDHQFTLGARRSGAAHAQFFQGELEEVRIWQTTRTEEQIQDNLFRRLPGEKEDLIAYYTFDAETGDQISDYSLRNNRLATTGGANYILSTAPIGYDTPQVRSALAGIRTPFSGPIQSAPAVQEYGDMQYDSQGNLIGVFKRCYSFILNGAWQIITGYKVGDLVTEWIGQVQFAPQLIGFIEGAPPVPSENLTMKSVDQIGDIDDYNESSVIELIEAEQVTYTYAASRDKGFDMSVDFNLGAGPSLEISTGIGVEERTIKLESKFGLKASIEHSLAWLSDGNTSVSRASSKTTSLELRGRFTTPEEVADEPFGRRFIPDNVGLALVKSETADVFALRLKHNGALIAYQMQPNPDIPKDWNIIHFPINPRYTKQGTLDGKIGLLPDDDYPNAMSYSPDSSYFKPIEAYALKNRIQREETGLQTYYEQYRSGAIGRREAAPRLSQKDLAVGALVEKLPQLTKRNLANTYVWTVDGGLFAEAQDTMDSQEEMSGGAYTFMGKAGVYAKMEVEGPEFGLEGDINALFGGHLNLTVTKTRQSNSAFQMNINLDKVERDIYRRDPTEQTTILLNNSDPKRPKPIKQPGKVDAYRFMSFYLEPQSDHFDDFFKLVVDPIWLEQSDDPGAAALRGARDEGKKPACWRVLHRVTYVSRVLPPFDPSAPPSLEKTLQTLDIDSNYELIKQLEPYVRDHLTPFSEFSQAVDDTLKTYLPELFSHNKEIKKYLMLYFGIDEEALSKEQTDDSDEIPEPTHNQPPTVKAGIYNKLLLLRDEKVELILDQATAIDDRLETDDLFLTWELLPSGQDKTALSFTNPHMLNPAAVFTGKGMYELRLTASDGILSASDKTNKIVVNEAPVIQRFTAGTPIRNKIGDALSWTVELTCEILTGLGNPSTYNQLRVDWSVASGSAASVLFGEQKDEVWVFDQHDPNRLHISKAITVSQSGYYLLKCSVDNGLKTDAQLNLEIGARVTDGLQVLYTFEQKSATTVADVAGVEPPIDLTVSNSAAVVWVDGGLRVKTPARLSGGHQRLAEALMRTNEITIEAWVKSTQANASGLRRIVALSNGPANRNFVLGQNGTAYHIGLRMTSEAETDGNASLRSFSSGMVSPNAAMQQMVFTRAQDGCARLYLNGQPLTERIVEGDFSLWDDSFPLVLGDELASNDKIDRSWAGEYHLVAIYNRALSPEEIQQNYAFGADRDLPPYVFAGDDREIDWSLAGPNQIDASGDLIVQMQGRVTHDRPTSRGNIQWSQISGPTVKFADMHNPTTEVYFPRSGTYRFRLTASDDIGQIVSREVMIIIRHETPVVSITIPDPNLILTADQQNTVTLQGQQVQLRLLGAVKNSNGGDYPRGKCAFRWQCDSSAVTFDDWAGIDPVVTFRQSGIYIFEFTVTNIDEPEKTASASVNITANRPPTVDAGLEEIVILPEVATLDATLSDDGLPLPPGVMDLTWIDASMSNVAFGQVTFADPKADYTTASFTDKGAYTLKLTAFDGAAIGEGTVMIVVNKAPVVEIDSGGLVKANEPIPLNGVIVDDGFGREDQRVPFQIKWQLVDGPAPVTFADDTQLITTVIFPQKGIYRLQLTVVDSYGEGSDQAAFTVDAMPVISAGDDQSLGENNRALSLQGAILDDGIGDPQKEKATISWEPVSGPVLTSFVDVNTLNPTVVFQTGDAGVGVYIFRLTVSNALFTVSDEVTIVVNKAPVVEAGADATVKFNEPIPLNGAITDEGFAREDQRVPITVKWEMVEGPAQPTLANDAELITTVAFPKKGIYVLQLTATDVYGQGRDMVTFTVNEPPVISAGSNQTVHRNNPIKLAGKIMDDGLGDPQRDKVNILWELVKGPRASFSNTDILNSTVAIQRGNKGAGVYVFRLTVSNGLFSASDEVTVTVGSDRDDDDD